jgi:uncharacterized membrane protein (UPF0127 family)
MGSFGTQLVLLFILCTGAASAGCTENTLELRGTNAVQRFSIETADTDVTRSKGLMFREAMPMSSGMLFVYAQPKHAYFWMKNTLIPLDMVFADETGLVTKVHSNAIPHDLTPIDGGDGVKFVLEINAGLAARMGIVPGTVMRTKEIEKSSAIWPCSVD